MGESNQRTPSQTQPAWLQRALPLVKKWAKQWGLPDLEKRVRLVENPRLRTSLGRARPSRGLIELNPVLKGARRRRFTEALCHELAHVAIRVQGVRHARPHGPEWRSLVKAAGFEPRPLAPARSGAMTPRTRAQRPRYEHRCMVCQFRRLANRRAPNWRCPICCEDGLPGMLVVTRRKTR
jgi:predicted SprT family Zn-dependent metalloprotease